MNKTLIERRFRNCTLGKYEGSSITDIDTSIESHLIAFAAEESRLNGTVIDVQKYRKRFL